MSSMNSYYVEHLWTTFSLYLRTDNLHCLWLMSNVINCHMYFVNKFHCIIPTLVEVNSGPLIGNLVLLQIHHFIKISIKWSWAYFLTLQFSLKSLLIHYLEYDNWNKKLEAVARRCSVKKVFLEISKNTFSDRTPPVAASEKVVIQIFLEGYI